LNRRAETYGKGGVARLITQRDQFLQRYDREPRAIDAITKSYKLMIARAENVDADAKFEGSGEKIKHYIESPLAERKARLLRWPSGRRASVNS
jgi:hypothetical protein